MPIPTINNHPLETIDTWLQQHLSHPTWSLTPLAGDASFRRYFRCNTGQSSYIVSQEPPADNQVSLTCQRLAYLCLNKIPVPKVYAQSSQLGLTLQQDLGDQSLWSLHCHSNTQPILQQAITLLDDWLALSCPDWPIFNQAHILQECQLIPEWLLPYAQHRWSATEHKDYHNICQQLANVATSFTPMPIHRDYHSRNLMWQQQRLYCIDVQDTMLGPCLYDLVSLLRDCYIQWPPAFVAQQLAQFYQKHRHHFIDWPHCQKSFDWIGVQRHLKAAGIFARLAQRDGKTKFLADIPPTLAQIKNIATQYADLSPLLTLLPNTLEIH